MPETDWLNRTISFRTITLILCGVAIAGLVFILVGGVPIAADIPHSWLTEKLLHFTFKRSVASRAYQAVAPADLSADSRVKIGAQHFDLVCSNCHGGPGIGQSTIALSMTPRPQNLPKVVGQFTDAELFQIVMHGVKFSAMPSWSNNSRDDEVWSMVAFLKKLPSMDAKTYLEMTQPPSSASNSPRIPLGTDIALRESNAKENTGPSQEFSYAAPAIGFGERSIRTQPVATCARCHGADGTGAVTGGEAPNLTIHDAAYLRGALEGYSSGARKSGFMQEIASQLSGDQIKALADYFAKLPVQTIAADAPADAERVKRGRTIAEQGVRVKGIPACANCHEGPGTAISKAPRIAGQSETFLLRQLGAFRDGGRGTTNVWNPMPAEAHDLSNDDIASLAVFYSSLSPSKGTDAPPPVVPVTAKGEAGAGKSLFEARCVRCHMNGGRGDNTGEFPDLTLHTVPFVTQTLYSFRAGKRDGVKMRQVAQALKDDDIANVAAYVASLPPDTAMLKPDGAAATRGEAIAANGVAAAGIPSCTNCHDAKGVAALALIPRLQGQSAIYLKQRLDTFAGPEAVTINGLNPMPAIAAKLTANQRADLAAYFASQQPLAK